MGSRTRISKWGSSLAVRIPKAIAEQWGVSEGTAIEISNTRSGVMLRTRKLDLAELVGQITPENLQPEVEFGQPTGDEAW